MIKLALIGCGNWGKNYLRNLRQLTGSELCFVCDENEQVQALLNDKEKYTSNYTDVLKDKSVRGVIIATPPASHYVIIKEALLKGKDVLVEKPMVLQKDQALELFELAKQKKLVLMCGHIMEFHPAVRQLKRYIQQKMLGEIYYLYMIRTNLGVVRSDVNVLWDLGVHDISLLRFIIDEKPEAVSAHGASYINPNIEDVVFLTLKYPSGLLVKIHVSWLDPKKTRLLTIVGNEKMVIFDDLDFEEKIKIYDRGVNYSEAPQETGYPLAYRYGDIVAPVVSNYEPLKEECQHFLECAAKRQEPLTGWQDTLWVMEILEKAQLSMNSNGQLIKLKWSESDERRN